MAIHSVVRRTNWFLIHFSANVLPSTELDIQILKLKAFKHVIRGAHTGVTYDRHIHTLLHPAKVSFPMLSSLVSI